METIALCFSIPVSFTLSSVYIAFLVPIVTKLPRTAVPLNIVSALVLAAFGIEILLPAQTAALLGPTNGIVDMVVFFLGVPALANILVTSVIRPGREIDLGAGFFLALACTAFAFFLLMLTSSGWPPLPCDAVDRAEAVGKYQWARGREIQTDLLLKEDDTFDETVKYATTWASKGDSRTEEVLLFWDQTYRNSGKWSLAPGKEGSEVIVDHSIINPIQQPPIYFDHRLKACKRDGGVFLQWGSPDSPHAVDFLTKVDQ